MLLMYVSCLFLILIHLTVYMYTRRYRQPSSQHFGIHEYQLCGHFYIFPVFKTLNLSKNEGFFLISGIVYLSRIWHNIWNLGSSMLFNFELVLFYNYFDMSVTDDSYVDETRVWRTKLQSCYLTTKIPYSTFYINNIKLSRCDMIANETTIP